MAEPIPLLPPTIEDAAASLRSGAVSSVELTRTALELADDLDATLGVYVARFDDTALAAARAADVAFAAGDDRGPLLGVPIGVKDLLTTIEGPTTGGSKVTDESWQVRRDAAAVRRLRAAGAVITGKLTLSELAIGRPDGSPDVSTPRNPWDVRRWPGGSSSGSGSGVAAGLVLGAVGTDTGGSIRMPAAFCGVTGLKPTFGRVPVAGCIPLARSLDHVGPLARSAADCAALFQVMADVAAVDLPTAADGALDGVRIGVVDLATTTPGASQATGLVNAAVGVLQSCGATVADVELPLSSEVRTANLVIIAAEAFAHHLGRLRSQWGSFLTTTKEMIAIGALVSSRDYVQARAVRRAARHEVRALFDRFDLIVTPTATMGAPRYGRSGDVDVSELLDHLHTGYWNCAGNPALAVPIGFDVDGLPLSMQLVARRFDDVMALRAGAVFQLVTDWHLRTPDRHTTPPSFGRSTRTVPTAPEHEVAAAAAAFAEHGLHPDPTELATFASGRALQRPALDRMRCAASTFDVELDGHDR